MIPILTGVGAALSFFLLLVLSAKRSYHSADFWLAVWFLAQGVFFAGALIGLAGAPRIALLALMLGQFALFLTGPAHYLYAASALGAPRHTAWHAATVAAVAVLVIAMPFAIPVRAEAGAMVAHLSTPWLLMLPLTGFIVASLYPLGVLRLVHQRRDRLKDQLSDLGAADPHWLRVWAWSILAINVGVIVAAVNARLAAWPVPVQVTVIMTLQMVYVAYVGQQGLTRPGVFFAPAHSGEPVRQRRPVDRAAAINDFARLETLLATDKPHRLPTLTAEMLADQLGWGSERLTAALRHGGGVNFFDAINAARVREVQQLARQPHNAHVSLLVLAHEAGFGSKTAFYDAFRRDAGCTPAAWKRRRGHDSASEVPN